MAFVIVQHLDPHHVSRLAESARQGDVMPVTELRKSRTKPNQVYVQPPNKCVIAKEGELTLVRRTENLNMAIDHFFESLAEACGSRAIGIVLSGTGSDGTAGLRAIKAAGGLTFAQSEASANSMPCRAAPFGPALSMSFFRREDRPRNPTHCRPSLHSTPLPERRKRKRSLPAGGRPGSDFSFAKKDGRRFYHLQAIHADSPDSAAHGYASDRTLSRYARFLRDNEKEIEALFGDLLINVTRFFRMKRFFGP